MPYRVDFRPYRRAFQQPLRTARGEWAVREGFLVRVEGPDGIGFGEVAPISEFGSETVSEAAAFLSALSENPEMEIPEDLPCCAFGFSAAKFAGRASCENAYPVSGLLPAGAAALDSLKAKRAAGFTNFKWKVGVESPTAEQSVFERLCARLPAGVRLRLDANGAWGPETVESWIEFLGPYAEQLDYIEQPLPVGQEQAMAVAMKASGVKIALDESLQGESGKRWLRAGEWFGPLVIKPALMGDVAQLAERLQPVADQVVLSSVFETSVGVANTLALASCLREVTRFLGFDTATAFDDGLSDSTQAASLSLKTYNPQRLWDSLAPLSK